MAAATHDRALDPVEAYDAMREAANRLVGWHIAHADLHADGVAPEVASAREVRERALAIDPAHTEAQIAAAAEFKLELARLRAVGHPGIGTADVGEQLTIE